MGVEQANLYVDHRQTILLPSQTSKLPQCSREALESSRQYSTYVLSDITGQALSALGRTKRQKLRKFDSEKALDDARAKKKAQFVVQKGDKTRFFVSSKEGAREVSSLAAMNPTNWAHLAKTAFFSYLASGFIPGAGATQYIPSNPFAVSTQTFGPLRDCSLLQTSEDISYVWFDNNQLMHRVTDPLGQEVVSQYFLTSSDINWGGIQIPSNTDDYSVFWDWGQLGVRWVFQKFDRNHQPVGNKATPFSPYGAERKQEVHPLFLADNKVPIAWMDWENTPYSAYHAVLDPTSNSFSVSPERISTTALNQRHPKLTKRNAGHVAVFSLDGEIKQQLYDSAGAKVGNETSVNTNSTGNQQFPLGTTLSDGSYLLAWAKINSSTNMIEGYYYRRYYSNGIPKDTTDQVLLEGNLGITDYGQEIIAFANAPDGTFSIFVRTDQNVLHQKFSASGSPDGNLEPIGTPNTFSVGGASFNNGFGICWTNISGVFSQIWQAIVPSTTTSTTSATSTTTTLVPTSSRTSRAISSTNALTSAATSSTSQTTSTTGVAATSSSVRSSSSSSSVVPVSRTSSNPVKPSNSVQESSPNVAKIIGVSLIAFISVAACVAIIGLIFLKRRKKDDDSEVELATRVTKEPKKKPDVTVYGSLDEARTSPDANGDAVSDSSDSEEPDYQALSKFQEYQD